MSNQPASALSSPRFCNMGTFMRMPRINSAKGMDFAIAGAPFDTASSFRSGSRFGPSAIRNISCMMKPNNVIQQVNIMDSLTGGDLGDFPIVPGYIHPTYAAIEDGVTGILNDGALPIVLGGDHSITLAELEYGMKHSSNPAKNEQALLRFLAPLTVLPFGAAAASEYGAIRAFLQSRGTPIGPLDMLIAAHAKSEKLTVVTNNVREFERVPDLDVENWAE